MEFFGLVFFEFGIIEKRALNEKDLIGWILGWI
ncbi:hypothetical protein BSPWISOXPB_3588 [uncultured Gammaproteobacteria bacterium]|nr:hypothetical protein BSPWISOXPB_3588 [uncultured Gammaproteobacteria bacterium]